MAHVRLTEARGFECKSHHLVMFGGAGGQHACSIAKTLGITRIIIPRYSSILSAHGMALADVVTETTEPAAFTVTGNRDTQEIEKRQAALVANARKELEKQGFPDDRIECETYLNCRYHGTSTQLMIEKPEDGNYESKFFEEHKREFGFNLENRNILVDDIRVRAVGKSLGAETRSPYADFKQADKRDADVSSLEKKDVYFDGIGWKETVLVPLESLKDGEQVHGPAIIYDKTQTLLIEPGHTVSVSRLRLETAWI